MVWCMCVFTIGLIPRLSLHALCSCIIVVYCYILTLLYPPVLSHIPLFYVHVFIVMEFINV